MKLERESEEEVQKGRSGSEGKEKEERLTEKRGKKERGEERK